MNSNFLIWAILAILSPKKPKKTQKFLPNTTDVGKEDLLDQPEVEDSPYSRLSKDCIHAFHPWKKNLKSRFKIQNKQYIKNWSYSSGLLR